MSFRIRLTSAMVLSMLFVVLLSHIAIQRFLLDAQLAQLREKLRTVAQTATVSIDPATLRAIPLTKEGRDTPAYKAIAGTLARVRDLNTSVRYIYILTKTATEGQWRFIVDIDPRAGDTSKASALPGDAYDASRFPEMLKAWQEPSADRDIAVDEWGATLSGYAPVRDAAGQTIAVLGVDMSAKDFYTTRRQANDRGLVLFILGVLVSFVVGVFLSLRITAPVNALVEGTERISQGDLHHQVPVAGQDEISQLATSFNKMAVDLEAARQRNQDYFYRVIESLVRIVEAKDQYTRGHSERVARYAAGIAVKMGFPMKDVDFIRQTALLHDIGKIGIQDELLHKPGALTDQEKEIVHQHPALGDEILRPVALSPEMLAAIRGHHERFDGKGYPDHLDGKHSNVFSQIICVADAYDAMTSTRAYRKTVTRDEALAELKRCRGTQFDPAVVDAFLALVREEVMPANSSHTA